MILRNWTIGVICLATACIAADDKLSLTVTVTGVTPQQGQVVASLFDDKKTYLKKSFKVVEERVGDSQAVDLVFTELAAGDYAVSVYYDVDDDGEMDTGLFGIPKEPAGFSNNAIGKFGPAKWKKTNFQLDQDATITIQLVNVFD